MGLVYGYDVYLRPGNVARVLSRLAELAPADRGVPPLEVTLPGGDRVVVPFASGFKSGSVDCSAGGTLGLDTSLLFDVDEVLREYAQQSGSGLEADGRVRVGYVYVTVRFVSLLHPGYASVECWAATSGMSRLFAQSAGVRTVFTGLAAGSGGVCCLFDTGDGGPEQVCWLNGEIVREMVGGHRFPDRQALVATWPGP
ncbi:hypothetical protein OG616_37830 [Streptomyces antibioticus]|uniref:hypothetical protein n=1 Tax=Streptomyces antibioticus TaxID=1890 RepID=UPI00225934BC|nr:hypothetical protein [Streptomyces antibioticus]MCX5166413.1 hypothetical protein [Streptomyces antibioticus]MCX5173750.1 hypothetical protein [Streptomyces antibioticus]